MAAIVWSDVWAIAAAVKAVPVKTQDAILAWVNPYFAASKWGGEDSARYKMVRQLLAAHFGTLQLRAAAAGGGSSVSGAVTSMTVSSTSESVSFAQNSSGDALQATEWGQMLAMMKASNAAARMPITW